MSIQLVRVTAPLSVYFDKSCIPAATLEAAAIRGTNAHAGCAAYARRIPVIISDEARPYFMSYKQWFDTYVSEVLFVEAEFTDPLVWFLIGHVDLICRLRDRRVVVVDLKTPQACKASHWGQVAAYRYLADTVIKTDDGFPLILDKDGGPAKVPERKESWDFYWASYLGALQGYRAFAEAA